jgi:hypothetical protein
MKYLIKETLQCRGAVDPEPPQEVSGILLMGEYPIATWETGHTNTGCDCVRIYPAIFNGGKSWVKECTWEPAAGYSASGTEEVILTFGEGVEQLLEHGSYNHLWAGEKYETHQ